jgi:hypothetical protein
MGCGIMEEPEEKPKKIFWTSLIVTVIYSTAFVGLNGFHPLLWRRTFRLLKNTKTSCREHASTS